MNQYDAVGRVECRHVVDPSPLSLSPMEKLPNLEPVILSIDRARREVSETGIIIEFEEVSEAGDMLDFGFCWQSENWHLAMEVTRRVALFLGRHGSD